MRRFNSSRNPYLRGTAGGAKGELPFKRVSAAVAIAWHIFHVTRACLAWQTGHAQSRHSEKSANFFLSRAEMRGIIRILRAKRALPAGKSKKIIQAIYQDGKVRLYFNKHPKNLITLYPQRKRVFREKEKTVKKTLIRILLAVALMSLGSTTVLADGGNLPPCPPKILCSVR